jgi:hypothetical protein
MSNHEKTATGQDVEWTTPSWATPAIDQPESLTPPAPTGAGDTVQESIDVFEQTRQQSKKFSKDFVVNYLNDKLTIRTVDGTTGEDAYHNKRYFDLVQATPAEHRFVTDPEAISKVHSELADLFRDELALHTTPIAGKTHEQRVTDHLDTVKSGYLQKLENDKTAVRTFAEEVTNLSKRKVRSPGSALEFRGLGLDISDGKGGAKRIDLTRDSAGDVRSNMSVQEEMGQTFVHWSSPELMNERMQKGNKPPLTRRIYLNPKNEDSVAIFREIIDGAKEQGLVMKGKVFDRASDAIRSTRVALNGESFTVRADGIVLYAGEDSNRLMALVQDVYNRREPSFKGRGNSLVPYRLADGLAIGDEPVGSGGEESLTTSRFGAVNDAMAATRQELGIQTGEKLQPQQETQAQAVFERHFDRIAREKNIDPNNLAFNLSEEQQASTAKSQAIAQAVAAATSEETVEPARQLAVRQLTKGLGKNLGADPARDERLRGFLDAAKASDQNTLEDFSQIAGEVSWIKQNAIPAGTPDSEVPQKVYEVYKIPSAPLSGQQPKTNAN